MPRKRIKRKKQNKTQTKKKYKTLKKNWRKSTHKKAVGAQIRSRIKWIEEGEKIN